MFVVFEVFADALISWLPLYYEAKLCLVIWLVFYDGASTIYDKVRCQSTMPSAACRVCALAVRAWHDAPHCASAVATSVSLGGACA